MFVNFATIVNIEELKKEYDVAKDSLKDAYIAIDKQQSVLDDLMKEGRKKYLSPKQISMSSSYVNAREKLNNLKKDIEEIKKNMLSIKLSIARQIDIDAFTGAKSKDDVIKIARKKYKLGDKKLTDEMLDEATGWNIKKGREESSAKNAIEIADREAKDEANKQINDFEFDDDVDIDDNQKFFVIYVMDDEDDEDEEDASPVGYVNTEDKYTSSLKQAMVFTSEAAAKMHLKEIKRTPELREVNLKTGKLNQKGKDALKVINVDNIVRGNDGDVDLSSFKTEKSKIKSKNAIADIVNDIRQIYDVYEDKNNADDIASSVIEGTNEWIRAKKDSNKYNRLANRLKTKLYSYENNIKWTGDNKAKLISAIIRETSLDDTVITSLKNSISYIDFVKNLITNLKDSSDADIRKSVKTKREADEKKELLNNQLKKFYDAAKRIDELYEDRNRENNALNDFEDNEYDENNEYSVKEFYRLKTKVKLEEDKIHRAERDLKRCEIDEEFFTSKNKDIAKLNKEFIHKLAVSLDIEEISIQNHENYTELANNIIEEIAKKESNMPLTGSSNDEYKSITEIRNKNKKNKVINYVRNLAMQVASEEISRADARNKYNDYLLENNIDETKIGVSLSNEINNAIDIVNSDKRDENRPDAIYAITLNGNYYKPDNKKLYRSYTNKKDAENEKDRLNNNESKKGYFDVVKIPSYDYDYEMFMHNSYKGNLSHAGYNNNSDNDDNDDNDKFEECRF